jgi:hypothetical protein
VLQVTQSLVQHLNTNMKTAIDKADDAEADSVQAKQQVRQTLQQQQWCAACVMPPEQQQHVPAGLAPGNA